MQVRKRIVHPKFQFRATQPDRFDLALLELVTEAGFEFHIAPICLPDANLKLTRRNAVVAGWGKIQPSNELMGTNVLRSATVPILGSTYILPLRMKIVGHLPIKICFFIINIEIEIAKTSDNFTKGIYPVVYIFIQKNVYQEYLCYNHELF